MAYSYSNGDGPTVLLTTEPDGATEPVSNLDQAIRQIKLYLNDPIAGPAALVAALLPTGLTILGWPTSSAPSGWLICDGSAVSRSTYATLFGVIGTTFGAGDGSTTFNLPDLRNRVIMGQGGANNAGDTGGEATHLLTLAEMPQHRHALTTASTPAGEAVSVNADSGTENRALGFAGPPGDQTDQGDTPELFTAMDKTSAGVAHNNLPPYIIFYGIIKT